MAFAQYYPVPEHRECGDCDVYLGEDWQTGNEVVEKLGGRFETGTYKHSRVQIGNLMVENHKYLTSFNGTKQGKKIERLMERAIEEGDEKYIDGSSLICPNDYFNALFLLRHDQAIMDGKNLDEVVVKLQVKADKLAADQETLITKFIEENFDNVLAPFAFQLVTENMQYPMLSPWIEALMSKATDTFKNNDYVREFMQAAERNQNIMNGMEEPAPQVPAMPADQSAGQVPTPNELAAPAQ